MSNKEGDVQNFSSKKVIITTILSEETAEINLEGDKTLEIFFKKSFKGKRLKNVKSNNDNNIHLTTIRSIKYITINEEEDIFSHYHEDLKKSFKKIKCTFLDTTSIEGYIYCPNCYRASDVLLMNENDRFIILHTDQKNVHLYVNNDENGPLIDIECL